MQIIQFLADIDTRLFLFLNGLHSSYFDALMFAISKMWVWIPLYISVIFIVVKHYRKNSIFVLGALILCVVLADQISSGLIKEWVQRPRPSREDSLTPFIHLVNGYKGGRFGFVSSHAANTFGFALLTSVLFRRANYSFLIIAWSLIVSYSRIYLGVHYPLDILGGFMVGGITAFACYQFLRIIKPELVQHSNQKITTQPTELVLIISVTLMIFYAVIELILK